MNIGDEKEINVTFPEEYHVDDLKGKPAMFKVSVKEIKEKQLPELNDEFAQDVSDFDTLAEYKDDLKNKIADRKSRELRLSRKTKQSLRLLKHLRWIFQMLWLTHRLTEWLRISLRDYSSRDYQLSSTSSTQV